MVPVSGRSRAHSEHLPLSAVRLTWRPLPNPQRPREMSCAQTTQAGTGSTALLTLRKHGNSRVSVDTPFMPVMLI